MSTYILTPAAFEITQTVRSLYEKHPYPKYPLLARPRWVDGYLASSLFSQRLTIDLKRETRDLRGVAGTNNRQMQILLGGSGEILPYIVRKWEPWQHRLTSLDISKASLERAKFRLALDRKPKRWVHQDLDLFLSHVQTASLGHIDVFGVIHHMPNPSQTLDLIAKALVPGGTARIMIYNSDARGWIHHIQRLFDLLLISPESPQDLAFARKILQMAQAWSPTLATFLSQMGGGTLANDARFSDTFLHPRECRKDPPWWLDRIQKAGLEPLGMLDRYAELDDLVNPLWNPPLPEALKVRSLDRRFEGNLEFFVYRPHGIRCQSDTYPAPQLRKFAHLNAFRFGPPRMWFDFPETQKLGFIMRQFLWDAFLAWVHEGKRKHDRYLTRKIPFHALQRLARIGAILPGQISDKGLLRAIAAPMTESMTPLPLPETSSPMPLELIDLMKKRLQEQDRYEEKRLQAASKRLALASRISP
jgi:SAM-dependent methyltransferase